MELTFENRKYINSLSYTQLLTEWRFSPSGNPWMEGPTGAYWSQELAIFKRDFSEEAIIISKQIGWK